MNRPAEEADSRAMVAFPGSGVYEARSQDPHSVS